MADFPGRLTVINGQSSLDNNLLLRPGIPDATQAISAATQFLLKTKKLMSGQSIIVTGNKGTFGSISVIVMTDARADPSQPFAVAASASALAAAQPSGRKATKSRRAGSKKAGAAKGTKKSGGGKSASASRKAGSKAGASKKSAARKSSAAKSSAKK
ncbi:MAG TPA: hypothetical protein VJS44_22525 [Pyrinomonadaceae bacterium]|nr:hypothetical protein [Pyrinomonadaceae bacterium]